MPTQGGGTEIFMRKKSIFKIIGAILLSICIIIFIFIVSDVSSNLSKEGESSLIAAMDLCVFGGIVFLIIGFKKNKKNNKYEMTVETAQSIIKKTEKIKNFAVVVLVIGVVLFLLGYFNKNILRVGVVLEIVGVYIGIFAKERKKYKLALKFIGEMRKMPPELSNEKTRAVNKNDNSEGKTAYKALSLSKFSFNDEARQKIRGAAIRYLPDDLSNHSAQLELLEMLSNVMEISVPKMKTEHAWKSVERIADDATEKEGRFNKALAETILAVDQTLGYLNPQFLIKKIQNAKVEELLKGWVVLDYYLYMMKPEYIMNIQHFRDYIHNAILEHEKNQDDNLQNDILNEKFQGFAPVNGVRNNEICDKFIANGIIAYSNNTFDENTLKELTFDEFCHVYSTIGWFAEKIAPNLKGEAISYKMFLRKKLLSRLSTMSVYTIYTIVNNLPYVEQDGSLLLYSNKKMAETTIENSGFDWLKVYEITPNLFGTAFCEYFCTGYKSVNINGKTKVKIEDVYKTLPIEQYGNICIESCTRMIDYKQTEAILVSRAKKEMRNLNEDEVKQLSSRSYAASVSLLKNTLLLPAETENGMPKTISVPIVPFADGRKFIGLFTDQGAINGYYKKAISCVAFPNLINDQYNKCREDANISGILINPGREEYMMTKGMLSQLFSR